MTLDVTKLPVIYKLVLLEGRKQEQRRQKTNKHPHKKKQETSTWKGAQYHYSLGNTNKNPSEILLHTH